MPTPLEPFSLSYRDETYYIAAPGMLKALELFVKTLGLPKNAKLGDDTGPFQLLAMHEAESSQLVENGDLTIREAAAKMKKPGFIGARTPSLPTVKSNNE